MGFKFSARAILALGKELISSDDVALYELLKNSVDAGSSRVEIIVRFHLKGSDCLHAIELIRNGARRSECIDLLINAFTELPIDVLDKRRTELSEIHNQEDLVTQIRILYKRYSYIEVRDVGHGMTFDDLSTVFLCIGTSSRSKENLTGKQYLGDKGIGRLSTMRLGNHLSLRTATREDTNWNLLDIDWTRFLRNDDLDAGLVEIVPEIGDSKPRGTGHGTIIRISDLTSDWDVTRFTELLQGKIARMVDPFEPGRANRLIVARHNGRRVQIPSISKSLLQSAHAVCHVSLRIEGKVPILEGEIDYLERQQRRKIRVEGSEVYSLGQEAVKRRAKRGHAAFKLVPVNKSAFDHLGPFTCDIYWYNRRIVQAIEGLTSTVAETRREISYWSGGLMLYRFGYRILPYGDPTDDWLGLDQAAFGQRGFKLNRQQVIGRVRLNTPHHFLSEQTNRQGLLTSPVEKLLRNILSWIIHSEMRNLINEADKIELRQRRAARREMEYVSEAGGRVTKALKVLRQQLHGSAKTQVTEISRSVSTLTRYSKRLVSRMEAVIQEGEKERQKFVYLAGIGLMTEFIFHELERAVGYTLRAISGKGLQKTTINSLKDQLLTLHKRIAAFDELTSERRQRKSRFDLVRLTNEIFTDHQREFGRHNIGMELRFPKRPFWITAVRGMVIQILENLIVNSVYWLKQQKEFECGFNPKLTVVIDRDHRTLAIEDNGPGVSNDRVEEIFEAFTTTKPVGQGRGLGLFIARDLAEYHGWSLAMQDRVGRIRPGRLHKFVLRIGKR